jgi:hypothetical protein
VVDPYTLLALLAGIALAAYFLRLALVAKLARKKRDVGLNDVTHHVSTGRRSLHSSPLSEVVLNRCGTPREYR